MISSTYEFGTLLAAKCDPVIDFMMRPEALVAALAFYLFFSKPLTVQVRRRKAMLAGEGGRL